MLIEQLEAIYRTLEAVSVSGRQNLDRMLGVMMELERMVNSLREEQNNGEHDKP